MLLVDGASTFRCQQYWVRWHLLTDDATVILSFTRTPADRRTFGGSWGGSAVDGWRMWPQLGGNPSDAATPSLQRTRATMEGGNSGASPRETQSRPPVWACVAAVSALVSHIHAASLVKPSYLAASRKPLYSLKDDFALYMLLWGFCLASFFSWLKDSKDDLYWFKH